MEMKDQLLKRSADAAQRAIRHYLVEEYDQFLIHGGCTLNPVETSGVAYSLRPFLQRVGRSFLDVYSGRRVAGGRFNSFSRILAEL
ncbi:MAG TPA: hypothetical protein VN982_11100 [Candidatus Dormibacteraeota bacterium]|nr:hypothetical protein [Candidatus Dormibacteraeota bacterium]